MRLISGALLPAVFATFLFGAPQSVQNGTLRINTQLVEVSVVVRDRNGPVTGLKREDFTVLDNGMPQRIDVFAVSDSRDQEQATVGTMPAGMVSNLMNADGEVPDHTTVILLDLMNTSNDGENRDATATGGTTLARRPAATPTNRDPVANVGVLGNASNGLSALQGQNDAIKGLVRYLRTIREGDRVALFVLSDQLRVIQDFIGDPTVLLRAAERIKALDLGGIEVSTQSQLAALLQPPPTDSGYVGTPGFADSMVVLSAISRATATADAFESIARHMSGLPGRKSLVWMSAGFPFQPKVSQRILGVQAQAPVETPGDFSSQLERAAKALNDADIAVYPVDYQGLNGSYPEVMMRLARATGGNVTYHTNDLKEAVATAVADGDVSYTLGFYAAESHSDGELHDLSVKVNRKSVDLHYRSGYYVRPNGVSEKQRDEIVGRLLGSEANSSQIGLVASREPDPDVPGSYRITISVDAANLELNQDGDRRTGTLRLFMRLESSKSRSAQSGAIPLDFTEEQFRNVMRRGFVIRQRIQAPPADRLRIVVQDNASGLAGALWLPLR